jgi:uncharacterized membrane protein YraQ (UPF0718 family)/copper chaperone CopZ
MAPYLLFGFFVAGVLSILINQDTVQRHLGGRGILPVVKAAVFGVPLPLCSCGVIPVGASLRKYGASRGATTSFLLSTPQTGVDSIFVTYSLLGLTFAIFRPIFAFVTGLVGGAFVELFDKKDEANGQANDSCQIECCEEGKAKGKLHQIFHYGFGILPQDLAQALLVGIAIAAGLWIIVPDDLFAGVLGGGILAMIVMMAVGIPIYVCATASVPIAAALIAKGVSPGAALVFLMTGPATNAATISTIWKVLGKRTAIIYLTSLAVCALVGGLILDYVFQIQGINPIHHIHIALPSVLENLSAILLLAVLFYAIYRQHRGIKLKSIAKTGASEKDKMETAILTVKGMTCNHCVMNVHKALTNVEGVNSVEVELKNGKAVVTGVDFKAESLKKAVEDLGYKVMAVG